MSDLRLVVSRIPANWPFRPARSPVFYGWVIWVVSTLGFLASIPGQTMGMAVFTEPLIEALGLTRTQLSLAYLFGTMASSFFLTEAGRWYDRYGARILVTASSVLLATAVFYISIIDLALDWFGHSTTLAFAMIFVGYFGVRFFGQGVLTSCSRNVLLTWFVRRRGLVSGIRGVVVSFGFSVAPLVLAAMIASLTWRGALWTTALIVGIAFSLIAFLLLRDSPASCGIAPDGDKVPETGNQHEITPSLTLHDARRSAVFWVYASSLAMHAMFGTALTFHVVSIFAEAGRGPEQAFAYFLPAAVFSTITNLVASTVVDRLPLKPFLVGMLGAFVAEAWGLLHLSESWGFWMLVVGYGVCGGLWNMISNLAFIRFYGPAHLGEISGFNTSITVFASAVGPAAFSLSLDYFGSYGTGVRICLVMLVVLFMTSIFIAQRELQPEA